jgi:hypothetical protein
LRKKQQELLKIKENVDKSLKNLIQEQRQIERKINSDEKAKAINNSMSNKKLEFPAIELMKR